MLAFLTFFESTRKSGRTQEKYVFIAILEGTIGQREEEIEKQVATGLSWYIVF